MQQQHVANGSPRPDRYGAKTSGTAPLIERSGAVSRRPHAPVLVVLTFLFSFRVFAQLIQSEADLPYLPAFQSWDNGAVPYAVLVIAQFAIIGTMIALAWRVRTNRISPKRWRRRLCLIFGSIYFSVMFVRLIAGLTILGGVAWFSKPLPALFHLVLVSFVLVLGHYLVIVAREWQALKRAGSR